MNEAVANAFAELDRQTGHSQLRDTLIQRLAEAGIEVVLFTPGCRAGRVCEMARLLEGGRIPIKLAEATPLAGCTNREDCACRYEAWPCRSSSSAGR